MINSRRIALKVDCDTFEGTRAGIPSLLKLFDKAGIRASFFFTLGPDRSGRAIRRVFTHKGFLRKMLRSNAVSLYGPKTMMYGTLLPAPMIGKRLAAEIRSVAEAGHEVGVHGWDHVEWHDHLNRMTHAQIEFHYGSAHAVFEQIFGRPARSSAAPGWHATPAYLTVQEKYDLLYASNTRGGTPFFPQANGRTFSQLEIPTTLPTWDEAFGDPANADRDAMIRSYVAAIRGTEVHTIHTEVEGMSYAGLFDRLIDAWKADGCSFLPMEDIANEFLKERNSVPRREIARVEIPYRGGQVSAGKPHAAL